MQRLNIALGTAVQPLVQQSHNVWTFVVLAGEEGAVGALLELSKADYHIVAGCEPVHSLELIGVTMCNAGNTACNFRKMTGLLRGLVLLEVRVKFQDRGFGSLTGLFSHSMAQWLV